MRLSVYVMCVFVGVMTDDGQTCILTVIIIIIITSWLLLVIALLSINSMTNARPYVHYIYYATRNVASIFISCVGGLWTT